MGVDDALGSRLRAAIAGKSTDQELAELAGKQIEVFRKLGNLDAEPGSAK